MQLQRRNCLIPDHMRIIASSFPSKSHCSVGSVEDLTTGGGWFNPQARPILSRTIDSSYCDRIHSPLTTVHCFGNGYVGKQSHNLFQHIIPNIFPSNVSLLYNKLVLTIYHTIPTFNNPKRSLLNTLWEKEKMLVTIIFSFSHSVFYQTQKEFLFSIYIYFILCKCFEPISIFVVW